LPRFEDGDAALLMGAEVDDGVDQVVAVQRGEERVLHDGVRLIDDASMVVMGAQE
jgi:hypothetical protein